MEDTARRLTDLKLEEMENGCLLFIPGRKKESGNDGKSPLMMLAGILLSLLT